MNTGTCLCGDITWEVDGDFSLLMHCHCSICRKVHGAAYGTFMASSEEDFRWTAGEEKVAYYASSEKGERPFCPRCGSAVPAVMDGMAFMAAGNIEGDVKVDPGSHIFVGSKACWFDITDDAQQFEDYPPEYSAPLTERPVREPETPGAIGGSCDCGKVAYEFDGPGMRMGNCHCSRCRKARSAAFATNVFVPMSDFRWIRGEDNLVDYKVEESTYFITTFCRDCSSPMPRSFEDFNVYMVPAGSIDGDPGCRPEAHIYVGSKASWHEITDDLPQFEEMPAE